MTISMFDLERSISDLSVSFAYGPKEHSCAFIALSYQNCRSSRKCVKSANKWIDLIQGGIGWKFGNKNPFATANTKISKWKCILWGPFISTFILISSLFSIMSHDQSWCQFFLTLCAPDKHLYSIHLILYHYPIIPVTILSSQSLSYCSHHYPIS